MNRPMSEIINSHYPSLTNSEKKVADYVLENLEKVIYYSVTDLSIEVGVGETTVLRFCRKIGLKGYQEFKLRIAQNLPDEASLNDSDHHNNLIERIANNTIVTIKNTSAMVTESVLDDAIKLLNEAKSIHVFGVGTSGTTAMDTKTRFLRIGKRVEALTDPHLQAMTASTLTEEDLVIGLSISGSTRDTIESLEIAKKNGAKVIAVTYYLRSPITQLADIVLPGGAKESPLEGGSLSGKMSQLYIIDLLCTGLALLNKEASLEMSEKTAKSVLSKIY